MLYSVLYRLLYTTRNRKSSAFRRVIYTFCIDFAKLDTALIYKYSIISCQHPVEKPVENSRYIHTVDKAVYNL